MTVPTPTYTLTGALEKSGLSPTEFSGQVALVTGSGRGIGRQSALAFARLGARVVVAELSDEGETAAREIQQAGGQALFVRTDVSDPASVARLVEETHRVFGPLDILINNAILCPVAPVVDMDPALFDRVIGVNLRGAFLTCRAFLPDMLARGSGTIINMISTDAMPGLSAYIASKQGISGFSQSLASEVGQQGVRVVAFGPGMVDTPAIRAAAHDLAPLLGFSEEQFLNMPLHPAYPGLMPPEHAGVATAYLAARLAGEYHGEAVNGYTILERAGVISAAPAADFSTEPALPAENPATDADQALALAQRLRQMIADTEAEFNRLPVFIRPMARGGFKGKAGQSLQDWARTADRLVGLLGDAQSGNPSAQSALRGERSRLVAQLDQLITYHEGVPAETARFTKDAEMLNQVARLTRERVADLRALQAALGKM